MSSLDSVATKGALEVGFLNGIAGRRRGLHGAVVIMARGVWRVLVKVFRFGRMVPFLLV